MTVAPEPKIDLTTVDDAKAWLSAMNIDLPPDDQVQQMITAVSWTIQVWLGRNLISQSYDMTFDGRGTNRIVLPHSPITAVSSLKVDGVSIAAANRATDYGYVFSSTPEPPANFWLAIRGGRFLKGFQNVEVSFTAGYPSLDLIPGGIAQAVREAFATVAQVAPREPGLVMEKVGGLEERFAFPSRGPTLDIDQYILSPNITLALTPFKRIVPAG